MVLHPHGIAPTLFTLDSWSPGAGLIHITTLNVLNLITKEKLGFMHTKRYKNFLENGFYQFCVGAISRIPHRFDNISS